MSAAEDMSLALAELIDHNQRPTLRVLIRRMAVRGRPAAGHRLRALATSQEGGMGSTKPRKAPRYIDVPTDTPERAKTGGLRHERRHRQQSRQVRQV